MERMIYIHDYVCPYCRYTSKTPFPIEHYEGGSAGYRTFRCPSCFQEIEE